MNENAPLTGEQIDLLVSAGGAEARIRSGELTTMETQALRVLAFVKQQMARLYPGRSFVYTELNVADLGEDEYALTVHEADEGPEQSFDIFVKRVRVTGDEEGEYALNDNLIGRLLERDFTRHVKRLIRKSGLPLHSFTAMLPFLADESVSRTQSLDQMLESGSCPPCSVMIHLCARDVEEQTLEQGRLRLEALMRESLLHGSVNLLGYDIMPGQPLPASWEGVIYRGQILL